MSSNAPDPQPSQVPVVSVDQAAENFLAALAGDEDNPLSDNRP